MQEKQLQESRIQNFTGSPEILRDKRLPRAFRTTCLLFVIDYQFMLYFNWKPCLVTLTSEWSQAREWIASLSWKAARGASGKGQRSVEERRDEANQWWSYETEGTASKGYHYSSAV